MEKILFMGSPEYAVPILKDLNDRYEITAVVTQPDQPVGRGKLIQAPAVKKFAESRGLKVMQPDKIRGEDFIRDLSELAPDAIIVAAYGKILPKTVLEFPRLGCINVHASLLPRWRGASPIYSAILNGDEKSGVTIMLMDEGIDTGSTLSKAEIQLTGQETTGSLTADLANLGADLLIRTLPEYFHGRIKPERQPESGATYSQLIKKEDGLLDFSQEAHSLERQIRACDPWPVAFFQWNGAPLRVWKAQVMDSRVFEPGQRGVVEKFPVIGTASYDLKLVQVQPAGKRVMSGTEFLNGARNWDN